VIELGRTAEPPVLETEARKIPVHRPVADDRDIERAAALLTGARRVAIVAGDGAAASGAGPEVLALAEALAARSPRLWGRAASSRPGIAVGRGRRQLLRTARQPHRA